MKILDVKSIVLPYTYGLIALMSLSPYFLWSSPQIIKITLSFALLITMFFLSYDFKINKKSLFLTLLYSFVIFFLQFSGEGVVLFISSLIILISLFLLLDNTVKYKSYLAFYNLFTLSLVPGLIIFIFIFIGFDIPWSHLDSQHELKSLSGLFYRNYIGTVVLSSQIFPVGSGEIFRFSGVFDEPGVVGTVTALLLVADGFRLKNYKSKIVFTAGLLSFSLTFYLLVLIFLLISKPRYLLYVLIPVCFFGIYLYEDAKQNPIINQYVIERFSKGFTDPASVDNRASECFVSQFNNFIDNGNVILGNGANAHANTGCDVSSYLTIIYNHGFLGLGLVILFYVSMLLSVALRPRDLYGLLPFVLIFSMSAYQRPQVFSLWMILIFWGGILFCNHSGIKSDKHEKT
ncbi:hypothetical protein ACGMNB_10780 [Shewanella oncorhynchi]|uniref:hypothetical protein n=1 Tax=Shewanella oncorhynchi TaxID=2726434 RepID=UPI00374654C6